MQEPQKPMPMKLTQFQIFINPNPQEENNSGTL